jgi:2-polyprenyl-3-methyl-5-hydroxy-6-metoxy-1,4-benzoquinol methylase
MLTPERIDEVANGVDRHIKSLLSYTEILRQIQFEFSETRKFKEEQLLTEIKELNHKIDQLTKVLQQQGILNQGYDYESNLAAIREILNSDDWPVAVPENQICDNPEKEMERAQSIVDMVMAEYFKDLKFLDYGCGHGQVAEIVAKNEASLSVGYDIKREWKINESKNLTLTTNFDDVIHNTPYDVILMYDVLDHCADPIAVLSQINKITKTNSKIYVRNHPWCSRHGGHLYLQKNKAFAHLVLDEIELERIGGLSCPKTTKIYTPLETYKDWFFKTGFKIQSVFITKTDLEDFFLNNILVRHQLKKHWGSDMLQMKENMQIDFVDYILQPNHSEIF